MSGKTVHLLQVLDDGVVLPIVVVDKGDLFAAEKKVDNFMLELCQQMQ